MRLYNTLTRSVDELEPRDEGTVTMYVCGPTVYDAPHIGHARPAIVPDVLRRWLEYSGLDVLHVRNITDVDDKIIDRAMAEGRHAAAVSEEHTRTYDKAMEGLRTLPPHIVPRATGHIVEMIELIQRLVEVGAAYQAGGDVLFSVRSFDSYGRLSGRQVDELRAGARVEPDEHKRDPLDFALWKAAKRGEPSWASPWGRGRPGWHIECSAMAGKYLGPAFDIHAGGLDLVFPHHENERAQSEAATGRRFARFWVHNGMLNMGTQKMSKSLGNVLSLSGVLDEHGPDVVRMFFLSVHYRSPIEYAPERLQEAAAALGRWTAFLRASRELEGGTLRADVAQAFAAAMDDDLATPKAQAVLFDLVSEGNTALADGRRDDAADARVTLRELGGVLGYDLSDGRGDAAGLVAPLVEEMLALRAAARERKDFAAADAIRDRLTALGIRVEDSADGVRWDLPS